MPEEISVHTEKIKRHISYSEFSSFKNCQHKYYLTYKLKLAQTESETLFLGNLIHSCLEIIAVNKIYDLKSVFSKAFKDNLEKKEDEDFKKIVNNNYNNYYNIFCLIDKKLDFHNRFKDYKVVCVEYKLYNFLFEYNDIDWYFKGYIDLIIYDEKNDTYIFIDWKTANKPWDLKKKILDKDFVAQINLYKYFYSKENNINFNNIKTKYYSLVLDGSIVQELEVNYSLLELEKLILELQQAIINIEALNKNKLSKMRHNPKKKILCNWCGFNNTKMCNDFIYQKFNEKNYIN